MVFTRFVEIGRVAQVSYGPDLGALVVIVNVVDQNRALVERISAGGAGVARKVLQFARMRLTEIKVEVKLNAAQKAVRAAAKAGDVLAKFAASKEGMVQAKRAKRASMTDFDRFKVAVARRVRSKAIRKKVASLKK
jgi:large subunit ribosomal protein L14e